MDWNDFLRRFADASKATEFPGFAAASEAQLVSAEKRLKTNLPPSYRAFLAASNGWQHSSQTISPLCPAEKIKWFRKEHREWIDAYVGPQQGMDSPMFDSDYFAYTEEGSAKFDVKHLQHCLCISEVRDEAVVLLNPMVVWPDGEWETWFFANWLPGAIRYPSFAEWMQQEYAKMRGEIYAPVPRTDWPVVYRDGPGKPERRVIKRPEIPPLPTILKNLKSPKERVQVKAVKDLARIGGTEAVATLIEVLKAGATREVRLEAAEALGRLRAPAAIEPLIAAVDDPWVNSTAVHALGAIPGERVAQYLLETVRSKGWYAGQAAYHLALRDDRRAIPFLVEDLLSDAEPGSRNSGTQGRVIAEFNNEAAYAALEPLVSHQNPIIRHRALRGVSDLAYLGKNQATRAMSRALLERRYSEETDESLRESIRVDLEITKGRC